MMNNPPTPKRPRGRPRKPDSRRRFFGVRLDEDERSLIRSAADACGRSASEWVRDVLLREAKRA